MACNGTDPACNTQARGQAQVAVDSVICFSCGDWWYHNRGHFDMQVMKRFARKVPILYVNAMGMRFPSVGEGSMFAKRILRKLRSVSRGLIRERDNFYVFSPFSVPFYSHPTSRTVNAASVTLQLRFVLAKLRFQRPLVWVVSPPAGDVVSRLACTRLVYQRTDDFAEFEGLNRDIIGQMDAHLVEKADLVVHVNRQLHENCLARNGNSLLTSHGVDYDMFSAIRVSREPPSDIACIGKPRVGFFGGIDCHTFDVELLAEVATELSEMNFVLVGGCSVDVSRLSCLPNVFFLGQKAYEEIPRYGHQFDISIMPWRQNNWIAACNPVKMKEYLAIGKPVVSTPFPEGMPYQKVIYFAQGSRDFAAAIRRALKEDSTEKMAERRRRVATQTWDALAEQLERAIGIAL